MYPQGSILGPTCLYFIKMTYQQTLLLSYYFLQITPNWLRCYYQWRLTERQKPFHIMVRKMAIKIGHVEMQSTSFWTDRYKNLCDAKYWYWVNAGINVCWRREKSGCNNCLEVKFLSHNIVNQVKKANKLTGIIRRSHSFLDIVSIFTYFSCLPSSWILFYGLVSITTKETKILSKTSFPVLLRCYHGYQI